MLRFVTAIFAHGCQTCPIVRGNNCRISSRECSLDRNVAETGRVGAVRKGMRDICCRSPDGVGGQLDLFRVKVSTSRAAVLYPLAAAIRR